MKNGVIDCGNENKEKTSKLQNSKSESTLNLLNSNILTCPKADMLSNVGIIEGMKSER